MVRGVISHCCHGRQCPLGICQLGFCLTGWNWLFLLGNLLDVLRMGAWFGFLVALVFQPTAEYERRHRWPKPMMLAVVSLGAAGVLCFSIGLPVYGTPLRTWATTSLMTSVFGLVLLELFYRSVPERSRWGIKPMVLALGGLFAFDVYLFADALLFSRIHPVIWSARAFAHTLTIPLVAFRLAKSRMDLPDFDLPARGFPLHRLGGFGCLPAADRRGGILHALFRWRVGRGAAAGAAVWWRAVPWGADFLGRVSGTSAGLARQAFFRLSLRLPHRVAGGDAGPVRRRGWAQSRESVVKALADLVESPGGGVWLRDASGCFSQQARLNMPHYGVVEKEGSAFTGFLLEREWVVNLAELRSGFSVGGSEVSLPEWASEISDMWLIVPLISSGVLVGFVILLTPRTPIDVNWEVLDLLKMAGRQAASYFARMQATEALIEARKFDAFNRMSAFVVHDLKNLVAQMSLMLRNAERHKDNPEFQADMLDTVRHVEERMRGLMTQLMEKTPINQRKPVSLKGLVKHVVQSKRMFIPCPVLAEGAPEISVLAHAERLERILGHIVQNALDATPEHGSVSVELSQERNQACITVRDTGSGMSAAFIREQLFKPFQTTKASGMGIGAYEAQQYVQELGEFDRCQRCWRGTRFDIRLPIAASVRNDGNEAMAN
jgi:signal transduction histidine kinase